MKDLYATLGVGRDADSTAIKKAYRARAQKAHPDKGGNAEQFGDLTLAYDTLRDPHRRAHYDRTGQTKPHEPDNAQAAILSCVAQAMEAAMATALEMDGHNPLTYNLLEMAKGYLRKELKNAKSVAQETRSNADLAQRAAEKFIRKNGDNQISAMFTAKADRFWASAKSAEGAADLLQRSLTFLDDYRFTPDPKAPRPTATTFHSADAAAFSAAFFGFDRGRNNT